MLKHVKPDNFLSVITPVIVEMVFNPGRARLLGFVKMLTALERGDYSTAADEMLDSRWHRQVGKRAEEMAERMRG